MASQNEITLPRVYVNLDNGGANGAFTELAAVTNQKIYIYGGMIVAAGSGTVNLKDGSTSLTGAMTVAAGTPLPLTPMPNNYPIFPAVAGNLVLTTGAALQVSGYLICAQG